MKIMLFVFHICNTCYIRSNITKHIAPKLFYPHELPLNGEINILSTKSCDNMTDLFTKSLLHHSRNVLRDLAWNKLETCKLLGETSWMVDLVKCFTLYSFLLWVFTIMFFSYKVFNETMFDTNICLISCFPHRGFSRDKSRHVLLLKPCRFMVD
jgi:hypothetical protein